MAGGAEVTHRKQGDPRGGCSCGPESTRPGRGPELGLRTTTGPFTSVSLIQTIRWNLFRDSPNSATSSTAPDPPPESSAPSRPPFQHKQPQSENQGV